MLSSITAVRVDREVKVGRNKPVLLSCVGEEGAVVEVIAKLAHRCERGCNALVAEAISAMFARDIGLPVPEPFVVDIDPELAVELFKQLPGRQEGEPGLPGYGSKTLPPGYGVYLPPKPLPDHLVPVAAEIMAFDVLIQNSDRLVKNPNCLTDGQRLAIIDHELAFPSLIIGWIPPWKPNSLGYLGGPMTHLFFDQLRGRDLDLTRLVGAVEAVTDDRLAEYQEAIPEDWVEHENSDDSMIESLKAMRGNISGIVTQLKDTLR